MLAITHTWTCDICGRVVEQKMKYDSRNMHVADFPLPQCWYWINDHGSTVCDNHTIEIKDRETEPCPTSSESA